MKRWSKLQKELYKLISDDINFQLHCISYPMHSNYGSTDLGRYYITINKEIIWDYPKDFLRKDGRIGNYKGESNNYPYQTDISDLSNIIRTYIDTPKEKLYVHHFEEDKWGFTNILKAADKRIGKRRLNDLLKKTNNKAAKQIIKLRLDK